MSTTLAETRGHLMASGKGRVSFLYGCAPWSVDHTPADDSTPINTWTAQTGLGGARVVVDGSQIN